MKVKAQRDNDYPALKQYRRMGYGSGLPHAIDEQVAEMDVVSGAAPSVESKMDVNAHMNPPRTRGVNPRGRR